MTYHEIINQGRKKMIHRLKYKLLCWLIKDQQLLKTLYMDNFIEICLTPAQWLDICQTPVEILSKNAEFAFKVYINE